MTAEDHSGGGSPCERLGAFVDGELEAAEAATFRGHLVECARCQEEMHALMQLAALARTPVRAEPSLAVLPPPVHARRPPRAMLVLGAVAVGVALVVAVSHQRRPPTAGQLLASLDVRRTSGWPSYAGPGDYRPYVVQRGQGSTEPLRGLGKLEEAGDWHGLGTVALARGEYGQALAYLRKAPQDAATLNDVGLALMDSGNPEAALEAYDRARELAPSFAPPRFNRALALDRLDLPRAALEEMRDASRSAEGGWKDEALRTARSLQATVESRLAEKARVEEAKQALLEGRVPDAGLVRTFPGSFRAQFYVALALAPDRASVERLLPLARELDELSRSRRLEQWVASTAARASSRRAGLAPRLRPLVDRSTPEERGALAREASAAAQDDQLLFVLGLNLFSGEDSRPFAELVGRLHDPYWDLRLAEYRAWVARKEGRLADAERSARGLLDGVCRDPTLSGPCANVALDLAQTYDHAGRPADGQRAAQTFRAIVARAPHPVREQNGLQLAGSNSAEADRVSMARAEFEELSQVPGQSCRSSEYGHFSLAQAYIRRGDAASARTALEAAPACPEGNLVMRAELQADLAVLTGSGADRAAAAERIRAAAIERVEKASAAVAVDRLVLDALRLMLDAEEGRPDTRRRLTEIQRTSRQVAGAEDEVARAARAVGFQLIRESRNAEALEVAASMLDTPVPDRCVLSVLADARRVGLVWSTGADALQGQVRLRSDSGAPAIDPGCASVTVLAPTGLLDLTRWLPPDRAWSIRVGAPRPAAGPTRFEERLLVRGALAPADLNLPPLRRAGPVREGWKVVEGPEATPSRVRAQLEAADLVDFEVHGIVDASAPDGAVLVLSPDARGTYAISAADIRGLRLERGPVVLLGACRSATGSRYRDVTWTLPQAFVRAGARAVYASVSELPDDRVGDFLAGVARRLEKGVAPSVALRDERVDWLRRGESWARDVVLFD